MSLETLKARALQIKTSVIEESITPVMVGTQFEEINDFIQSGNIYNLLGSVIAYYRDGDIEFSIPYDTILKDVKCLFSMMNQNIDYQTEITTPLQDANVYVTYTKNDVLYKPIISIPTALSISSMIIDLSSVY